jgi:hypothetical protein
LVIAQSPTPAENSRELKLNIFLMRAKKMWYEI